MTNRSQLVRARLIVYGRVQGVGYRYFVSEVANELGIVGEVRNIIQGNLKGSVSIVAEGEEEKIKKFIEEINIRPLTKDKRNELMKKKEIIPPQPLARVDRIDGKDKLIKIPQKSVDRFEIKEGPINREMLSAIKAGSYSLDSLRRDMYHDFFVIDKKYGDISEGMRRVATMLHKDFRLLIYVMIALAIVTVVINVLNKLS